eukprot:3742800-Pyramimonas_sp.AAC.1
MASLLVGLAAKAFPRACRLNTSNAPRTSKSGHSALTVAVARRHHATMRLRQRSRTASVKLPRPPIVFGCPFTNTVTGLLSKASAMNFVYPML